MNCLMFKIIEIATTLTWFLLEFVGDINGTVKKELLEVNSDKILIRILQGVMVKRYGFDNFGD